jgi:hypothetical protein
MKFRYLPWYKWRQEAKSALAAVNIILILACIIYLCVGFYYDRRRSSSGDLRQEKGLNRTSELKNISTDCTKGCNNV